MEMKMEEHYLGDDIPVRFDVSVDGKPVTPTSTTTNVYDPQSRYIATGPAKCANNEVRYILAADKVETTGIYTFIFKVSIRGMGDKSHVVKVKVINLPVERKVKHGQQVAT